MAHSKGWRAGLRGPQGMQRHRKEGANSPRPERVKVKNDVLIPGM